MVSLAYDRSLDHDVEHEYSWLSPKEIQGKSIKEERY